MFPIIFEINPPSINIMFLVSSPCCSSRESQNLLRNVSSSPSSLSDKYCNLSLQYLKIFDCSKDCMFIIWMRNIFMRNSLVAYRIINSSTVHHTVNLLQRIFHLRNFSITVDINRFCIIKSNIQLYFLWLLIILIIFFNFQGTRFVNYKTFRIVFICILRFPWFFRWSDVRSCFIFLHSFYFSHSIGFMFWIGQIHRSIADLWLIVCHDFSLRTKKWWQTWRRSWRFDRCNISIIIVVRNINSILINIVLGNWSLDRNMSIIGIILIMTSDIRWKCGLFCIDSISLTK